MKTFIVFLNKLPEYPRCYIHEIEIDDDCLEKLQTNLRCQIVRLIKSYK